MVVLMVTSLRIWYSDARSFGARYASGSAPERYHSSARGARVSPVRTATRPITPGRNGETQLTSCSGEFFGRPAFSKSIRVGRSANWKCLVTCPDILWYLFMLSLFLQLPAAVSFDIAPLKTIQMAEIRSDMSAHPSMPALGSPDKVFPHILFPDESLSQSTSPDRSH